MPIDPNIPLRAGTPAGPFGPDMAQVYAAQNQQYRNFVQNQDIAGQNALQGVFANQNNLNPATGLPTLQALAPVGAANPNTYVDFLLATQKLQDQQQRTAAANFAVRQKYNASYDHDVAGPLIELEQQLQGQNLLPDQRQVLLVQKQKQLTDAWQNANAVPDNIRAAVDRPYDDTLAFRSEAHRKQTEAIEKGWSKPLVDTATGKEAKTNIYLGPGYWDPATLQRVEPKGNMVEATQAQEPEQYVDITPGGRRIPVNRNKLTGEFTDKDGKPYTAVGNMYRVGTEPKTGGTEKFLPAPLEAEVKQPDGTFKMTSIRQQQDPGGNVITKDSQGNVIPPEDLGQIRPASAARPRSAATAFITKYMEEHPDATADDVSEAAANFAVQQGGAHAFLAGGRQGDSIRFIGNVVGSHLPTLETLVSGLENKDVNILNRIKNTVQTQFGWSGALDFNAAKTIVGGEIVKAIQGYAGAEGDRERVLKQLSDARSEPQLRDVIYTMRSLMAGQLAGLYRQAKVAKVPDDKFFALLPPAAKSMLQKEMGVEETQGATSVEPPSRPGASNAAPIPPRTYNSVNEFLTDKTLKPNWTYRIGGKNYYTDSQGVPREAP